MLKYAMPNLYIIAGCNGAGKTTASYTLLPQILNCREFVNADSIAAGLSPFEPDGVAFEAGRIMLRRIRQLMNEREDFAFETTLSTRSYVSLVREAQGKGYIITLVYFWLRSFEQAMERVRIRVSKGGHHIPTDVIKRRYDRGIDNLFHLYIPACDYWLVVDNSGKEPDMVAEGETNLPEVIYNTDIWDIIKEQGRWP
ncbi:putative ABC-type ATPase [Anseongella ginsenosidimutans]|uniref:Putative ABC-type ATPase n=1 Tax=Anseongella ginsenosidimutans TaxID=496056 RepID=A0A4R3KSM1_9SPHI|nr:zeta toxin family protein [Anseongella ginsenosidimutans]TCS87429.1 putative ABC-type ATPase [Anseongella ginsenosidimutans]